ncbi:MAG: hypothetical protein ACRDTX_20425 [Pseudonocardiaceae bacterium]
MGSTAAAPEREADVLRRGIELISDRLPSTWKTTATEDAPAGSDGRRADAVLDVVALDGSHAVLVVEAKRSVVVRDLQSVVNQLSSIIDHLRRTTPEVSIVPVVAARYLAPSARQWLQEHEVSYVDATGNLRVVVDRPALFLRETGADRDPWRGPGRPRATLQGPSAARVVRALVDCTPPFSVPELVRRSGASTGATYRVVEFLEREALIERQARGRVVAVQWRRVLERWSEDYEFQRSNATNPYLQPRGLGALLDDLRASPDLHYALTGSFAAERLAPYAPPRLAMLYSNDPAKVVDRLALRAVDGGANVLVAGTDFDVVFDRTVDDGGLRFVAPGQAAVDLLTAPGRGPSEGQALLDWMQNHEADWRH